MTFDLAAHLALIDRNLSECPWELQLTVRQILDACLALAGLGEVTLSQLNLRIVQGETVYGQIAASPRASAADVAAIQNRIANIQYPLTFLNLEEEHYTAAVEQQMVALREGLSDLQNPLQQQRMDRFHVVAQFETLPIIAQRYFSAPGHWEAIARTNNIEYPYVIFPGQRLRLPEIQLHP